jgi:hypothetical protein
MAVVVDKNLDSRFLPTGCCATGMTLQVDHEKLRGYGLTVNILCVLNY